ncbi:MAG: bacteriocin fulvocin C-related protein [Porphyromonadaceae bacterium]|nr:bacteriocin fulvocin C-related protein [Porphyromonadaceae bacterium]
MGKFYFIFLLFIVLFSCQKSEFEFSCDPVINAFISENREELSQITVKELVSYEPELQRAVFNSWDYRKKRNAWIDKLYYVLANETFTEAETSHVQKLIDHIGHDYFLGKVIHQDLHNRSGFAADWIAYAFNELEWAEQFVAFMVFRLYTNQSQLEAELSALKLLSASVTTNSEGSCDCNLSADFCGTSYCRSSGCSTGSSSCGWLWSMPCDGVCY